MHTTNSGGGHLTQRALGPGPRTPTRGRRRGRTTDTAGHGARARRPLRRPLRPRQPHRRPHRAQGPRQDWAPQAGSQGAPVRARWWVSLTVRSLTFRVLRCDRFVCTAVQGRRHPWPRVRSQRYHGAQGQCICEYVANTCNKCAASACIPRTYRVGWRAAGPGAPRNEPGVCQAQALGRRHHSLAVEWW
jgi:hypothetical protein